MAGGISNHPARGETSRVSTVGEIAERPAEKDTPSLDTPLGVVRAAQTAALKVLPPAPELNVADRTWDSSLARAHKSEIDTRAVVASTGELIVKLLPAIGAFGGVHALQYYWSGATATSSVPPEVFLAATTGLIIGAASLASAAPSCLRLCKNAGKALLQTVSDPLRVSAADFRETAELFQGVDNTVRARRFGEVMAGGDVHPIRHINAATALYDIARIESDPQGRFEILSIIATELGPRYRDYAVTGRTYAALAESIRALAEKDAPTPDWQTANRLVDLGTPLSDGRVSNPLQFAEALIEVSDQLDAGQSVDLLLAAWRIAPEHSLQRSTAEELAMGRVSKIADGDLRFTRMEKIAALPGLGLESRLGLARLLESVRSELSRENKISADLLIQDLSPDSSTYDHRAKARLKGAST